MDSFFALFYAMGVSSMFYDNWSTNFDVIGYLPLEVAIIILRKLDPKSLVTATRVCSRWLRIVKADRVLRETVRKELERQRKEKMEKRMMLSRYVPNPFAMKSKSKSRREASTPYADPKKICRKFEKSIKTVDKEPKMKWVSVLSTNNLKKMR